MASVRKRKWTHNGVEKEAWQVSYTIPGTKKRTTETFDKKKDADRFRTKVETEIENGTHTAFNESVKVSEAARDLIRDYQRRAHFGDITNGYARASEILLTNHIVPRFGQYRLCEITPDMVQAFVDDLRGQYREHHVAGIYKNTFRLMTHGVKRKWLKINPLREQSVRLPKLPKRTAIPTKADIAALLQAADAYGQKERLASYLLRKALLSFAIFGGLRPGECYGLQWEDIDFRAGVINVKHSHTRTDGLKSTKTEAGVRKVPLTDPMRAALHEIARYQETKAMAEGPGFRSYDPATMTVRVRRYFENRVLAVRYDRLSGFVMRDHSGRPVTASTTYECWKWIMQKAGLWDSAAGPRGKTKFTAHALRHAAASLFIEAGMPKANLKEVMGHASISTTYDVYGHLFQEDSRTREVAESIAASFYATRARHEPLTL